MSKLLLDEHPLVVLPKLAQAIGLNETIVLQQVHYWIEKNRAKGNSHHSHEGHWWTWNTYEEWQENFRFWSIRTVRRIIKKLREPTDEQNGRVGRSALLICGNFNKQGYDRTLWYRIDYDELARVEASSGANCPDDVDKLSLADVDKLSSPIPETTQRLPSKVRDGVPSLTSAAIPAQPPADSEEELPFTDPLPKEKAAPAKPKEATIPSKNAIRASLETRFVEKTRLPPPRAVTVADRKAAGVRWWKPLREIAELSDWDEVKAKRLLDAAIQRMRKDKLTISAPQSILQVATAIVGERRSGVYQSRDGPAPRGRSRK